MCQRRSVHFLFPSFCWHIPLIPSVILVGVDALKGSKCILETVFDLSAGGIIMHKTLLHLSGKGEQRGVSSYTRGKQLLSGPV